MTEGVPSSKEKSVKNYTHKDPIEYVRIRYNTWIGPGRSEPHILRVFDFEDQKLIDKEIRISEALEKVYLEILNNAVDNVYTSYRQGVDPKEVYIKMNRTTIQVINHGYFFPVEIMKGTDKYNQTILFGKMFSGSNFGDSEDVNIGVNGVGSSITNALSSRFDVYVEDPINKLTFHQAWSKGKELFDAVVKENKSIKETTVRITFTPDFEDIFTDLDDNIFSDDLFELFCSHVIDSSLNAKVKTVFDYSLEDSTTDLSGDSDKYQTLEFNIKTLEQYGSLMACVNPEDNYIYHIEKAKTDPKSKDQKSSPFEFHPLEVLFVDSSEPFLVSFANGSITREHGVHVDEVLRHLAQPFISLMNGNNEDRIASATNVKKASDVVKKAVTKQHTIEFADVRKHMSAIILYNTKKPEFHGNFKARLKGPKPSINISRNKMFKDLTTWTLWSKMKEELEIKKFKSGKKSDGKKCKRIDLEGFQDANLAGTKKSYQCTLFIVEGLSAAGYPRKLIDFDEAGKDIFGIFPLKGKPLNMMNASVDQIEKNREIVKLKQVLGLREGMDYLNDDNYLTLRYGNVIIMADADTDGYHITALNICNFFVKFESLLRRPGFMKYWRTPAIRMTKLGRQKEKERIKFYNTYEYDDWMETTKPDLKKWDIKYFKGLGTCNDSEVKEDYEDPRPVTFVFDSKAPAQLKMAFDVNFSFLRKEWIDGGVQGFLGSNEDHQKISDYITKDFVVHPLDNNKRCIGSHTDGLKESTRKMLHCAFRIWGKPTGTTLKKDMLRVSQLAGDISKETAYKHGEASLCQMITKSMQDYIGSNNIPLLQQDGQAGTRTANGKDAAAPRYLTMGPTWFWKYVFRDEDNKLLDFVFDDGIQCEPVRFHPIICWCLVNGTEGIGTGYSSFIPPRNPEEIILWHMMKLKGHTDVPEPLPFWRNYKGDVAIVEKSSTEKLFNKHLKDEMLERKRKRKEAVASPSDLVKDPTRSMDSMDKTNDMSSDDDLDHVGSDSDCDLTSFEEKHPHLKHRKKKVILVEGSYKWEKDTLIITEIPLKSTEKYIKFLNFLHEKKIIKDYRDLSRDKNIHIEVYLNKKSDGTFPKQDIKKLFRLYKTYSLSNLVLLDDLNRPVKYDTVTDILETFHEKRLQIYKKRKKLQTKQMEADLKAIRDRVTLIQALLDKRIRYKKRPKADIIADIDRILSVPGKIFETIRVEHLTMEEIEKLNRDHTNKQDLLEKYKKMTPEDIWFGELQEFLKEYRKRHSSVVRFMKKAPF